MRTESEVLAMLATVAANEERGVFRPIGTCPDGGWDYWITDEEKAAYRDAWKAAGFFVMKKHDCSYGTYQVSAGTKWRETLGNLHPDVTKIWSTGEEGREDRV